MRIMPGEANATLAGGGATVPTGAQALRREHHHSPIIPHFHLYVRHDEHGDPRAMIARLQGKLMIKIVHDMYDLSQCAPLLRKRRDCPLKVQRLA